jgi:transcriptional regulator with GAF, ATPase, and Fis domain
MTHDDDDDSFEADSVAEEADLQASMMALSRLAIGQLGLEELLTNVALFAAHVVPRATGAGLTLAEPQRFYTVVATADVVREIEDIQHRLGEGPCISAMQQDQTVLTTSLAGDPRWPRLSGRVARLGLHSVVSFPLKTPDGVIGAINVYAHAKDAFTPQAAEFARLFAVPAIAVQNAQILEHTRRLAAQLQHAIETRGNVDRAVGIIMSRTGTTPEEALSRLRQLSQTEHRKLTAIADDIVSEAARRARDRHGP